MVSQQNITIIGVGYAGAQIIAALHSMNLGVTLIVCDTDSTIVNASSAHVKIQLGADGSLGVGSDPLKGADATKESINKLEEHLTSGCIVIIITGMGGGTGSGGTPVIAEFCKKRGHLTIGVATMPFSYEGRKRKNQAAEGIENLSKHIDMLIQIPQEKLRKQYGNMSFIEAFAKSDTVVAAMVSCLINSFRGHEEVSHERITQLPIFTAVAYAQASGDDRAEKAIEAAFNSPLFQEYDIETPNTFFLLHIVTSEEQGSTTYDTEKTFIEQYIVGWVNKRPEIFTSISRNEDIGDEVKVTLMVVGAKP